MRPKYHPSESSLLFYTAGTLTEGPSLVVACHLSFCDVCRRAVAEGDSLGGALLEDLTPVPITALSRQRILDRLDETQPSDAVLSLPTDPVLPAPLRRYLREGLPQLTWRRFIPGIRQVKLLPHDRRNDANLRLLLGKAGRAVPIYGRGRTEFAIVLAGSFSDEHGRFERGDVAELDGEQTHRPVIDGSEECICLLASEGAFLPRNPIARLARRWIEA